MTDPLNLVLNPRGAGRLRQRHAARLRRGLRLPGARRPSRSRCCDEQQQPDLRRLAAVPGRPGGREPGRSGSPPTAWRSASCGSWSAARPGASARLGPGLVHPGLGGHQLRRDARPAALLRRRTRRSPAMRRRAGQRARAGSGASSTPQTDPNTGHAGERGAQPVLQPGQRGQPAVHGRGRARLAHRPRRGVHHARARRTRASRTPRAPRAGSSAGPTSPTAWSSTSRTRPASAACA